MYNWNIPFWNKPQHCDVHYSYRKVLSGRKRLLVRLLHAFQKMSYFSLNPIFCQLSTLAKHVQCGRNDLTTEDVIGAVFDKRDPLILEKFLLNEIRAAGSLSKVVFGFHTHFVHDFTAVHDDKISNRKRYGVDVSVLLSNGFQWERPVLAEKVDVSDHRQWEGTRWHVFACFERREDEPDKIDDKYWCGYFGYHGLKL